MKCYYCKKECEGFVFEQGDFSVVAHRNCAAKYVDKHGKLQKEAGKVENKWLDIEGSILVDVDEDTFNTEFLEWIESKGWAFFGFMKPTDKDIE